MAFTGTAVKAGETYVCRITGLSLATSASGTITANGGGGDVELPSDFPSFDADKMIVTAFQTASGGLNPIIITKSGSPFDTITIENTDAANATGALEIFVQYIHSISQ